MLISLALIRFAHDRGLLRDLSHCAVAPCEPIPRSEVQSDNVSSHHGIHWITHLSRLDAFYSPLGIC
jgi:hypothetical protein